MTPGSKHMFFFTQAIIKGENHRKIFSNTELLQGEGCFGAGSSGGNRQGICF